MNTGFGAGCVTLNLPFGMALTGSSSATPGMNFDPMRSLLVNLSGVLAPLVPIFKIIGFAKDVVDALEAIPSCITNLSPSKLIQTLKKVEADISELVGALPPLTVPVMMRDLCGALIVFLTGVQSQIRGLQVQATVVVALQSRADSIQSTNPDAYAELTGIVSASLADGASYVNTLDAQSCAYNGLITTIVTLAKLAGLPPPPLLPCFNFGTSVSPTAYNDALAEAIAAIQIAIDVLTALALALGGATEVRPPC